MLDGKNPGNPPVDSGIVVEGNKERGRVLISLLLECDDLIRKVEDERLRLEKNKFIGESDNEMKIQIFSRLSYFLKKLNKVADNLVSDRNVKTAWEKDGHLKIKNMDEAYKVASDLLHKADEGWRGPRKNYDIIGASFQEQFDRDGWAEFQLHPDLEGWKNIVTKLKMLPGYHQPALIRYLKFRNISKFLDLLDTQDEYDNTLSSNQGVSKESVKKLLKSANEFLKKAEIALSPSSNR